MTAKWMIVGVLCAAALPAAEWEQTWQISRSDSAGKVEFRVERRKPNNRSSHNSDVPLSRFKGLSLTSSGPVKFEYVTDPGTLVCEGQMSGGRGLGTFTLRANPQYSSELAKLGYTAPDEEELFTMILVDVSLEFARGVKSAGIAASTRQLTEMRIHGLTLEYISAMGAVGYPNLTAREFIEMKIHGVSPEFVKELKAAGYTVPARQIIEMKIHGIDAAYVRQLNSFGLKPDPREVVEMKIHGVSPEYLKGMQSAGVANFTIRDVVEMKIHGVSPEFVKELKAAGYTLSVRQIVEMKIHGIDSAYVRQLNGYGLKPDPREVVEMKIHGVNPEFVKETKSLGYQCSTRQLIEMKIQGVDGAYLRKLRDAGMKNLTPEQVIKLKIHGVN